MSDAAPAPALVELGPADIPGLLALSEAVDWDFTRADFETAFACGRMCGHKDAKGRLISSAGLSGYGEALAWIGTVMVLPDWQRRGLGVALMGWCHALAPAPGGVTGLIATEEGARLYDRLGYRTVGRVRKAFAEGPLDSAAFRPPEGLAIAPFGPEALAACLALDRAAIGADRAEFLRARLAQAEAALMLRDGSGAPCGFVLGVPREAYRVAGPLAAPDAAGAAALIAALGEGHEGRLRIDVPEARDELVTRLPDLGFREVGPPPMMTLDGRPLPAPEPAGGRPGYYAISAQAHG